jgi:membrane-associated HD superfamily phosphohydrolase
VNQSEATGLGQESVSGLDEVESALNVQLKATQALTGRHRQALFAVTQKLLRPNLTFNKNETEARKRAAREAVMPVLSQVKKGEMIVREGERISEEQIKKLRALRDIGNDYNTLRTAFGLFIAISLLLFSCHRFARRNIRKYRPQSQDLIFLVSIFIGLFVLIKLSIFISNALRAPFLYRYIDLFLSFPSAAPCWSASLIPRWR